MSWRVVRGDCLATLAAMEPESVHAVVTDPPYEIGFMGRAWDATGIAYDPETWAACLRVLKPGGHLLAFGATRTYHGIATAIERAGFEVRDCLMWMYGSGFPKSLDVSKAIDKRGGNPHLTREIGAALRESRERRGITAAEADRRFCGGSTLWTWYEGRPAGQQMPTADVLRAVAEEWPEIAPLAERIAEAERQVVGEVEASRLTVAPGQGEDRSRRILAITEAKTSAASDWQGWGTALKPAWEPIVLARKPLGGTVAANVLAHGTGALNIDGCRLDARGEAQTQGAEDRDGTTAFGAETRDGGKVYGADLGRWPANIALDPEAAAALDAQTGDVGGGFGTRGAGNGRTAYSDSPSADTGQAVGYGDQGGASRFFYVAKPSTAERNAGLDGFEAKVAMRYGEQGQGPRAQQTPRKPVEQRNVHPTVKPIELMRWLVRLVTPPGGTVVDPFTGSGTTGCAAVLEGFDFIGCELGDEYADIADARIGWWERHAGDGDTATLLAAAKLRDVREGEGQVSIFDVLGA